MATRTDDPAQRAAANEGIIGVSETMQEIFKKIDLIAHEDVTVLLLGETGTGKEIIARRIHAGSKHSHGPFVAVNMGAIATELVSSELFGHEKGAFTGATEARQGLFAAAENGTIFLDELSSMAHKTQTALLRILENRTFRKVGGNKHYTTNTRIIAANDADLRIAVEAKKFRRDLMYRLEVFTIQIPPLRERREEIPALAAYFIKLFSEEMDTNVTGITEEAFECLLQYNWPGNVRELKNVVQSAMLLAETEKITPDDLPTRIVAKECTRAPSALCPHLCLKEVFKLHIAQALQSTNGNKSRAAEALGVSRQYLYSKIAEYKIDALFLQ